MANESQATQSANPFPFLPGFGVDAWRKAAEVYTTQMQSFFDAATAMDTRNGEQVRNAIEESARLMRESLTYATQLSADARKLSLATARQMIETTPNV